MKYLIKYNIFNESIGGDYLYHFTSVEKILSILYHNKLFLSSDVGRKYGLNKRFPTEYYITFSRSPDASRGYANRMDYSRIVFNKSKLKSKYKIYPYDYYGPSDKRKSTKDPTRYDAFNRGDMKGFEWELNMNFEYEERLFTKKPVIDNAINYIERIDLLLDKEEGDRNITINNYINKISEVCNDLGIECNIYDNKNDMTWGKNKLKSPEYKDIGYYHGSNRHNEEFHWDAVIAIMIYEPKFKDYRNREECYSKAKALADKYNFPCNDTTLANVWTTVHEGMSSVAQTLSIDASNYYKHHGKQGIVRDKFDIFIKWMRSKKCDNIDELVDYVVKGLLPKSFIKRDWMSEYNLGRWVINYDNEGEYISIPNDTFLKDITEKYPRFNYNPYSHYKSDPDVLHFEEMVQKNLLVGNFINWILNKFTTSRAKELIEMSSFDGERSKYTLLFKGN